MTMKNTHEAQVYEQLKKEADYWEDMYRKYPGDQTKFTLFMEAELKCADYAMDNESEIWDGK